MESPASALLLAHAASTLMMTGLIWFVQLVHYPLFPYAEGERFTAFAADHSQRTSWVVIPLMLTELATATLLLTSPAGGTLAWVGWGLLVSIWLSTFFVQVPCHQRLGQGFDPHVARRLVLTNWWRTLAWTARAGVALWLLSAFAL